MQFDPSGRTYRNKLKPDRFGLPLQNTPTTTHQRLVYQNQRNYLEFISRIEKANRARDRSSLNGLLESVLDSFGKMPQMDIDVHKIYQTEDSNTLLRCSGDYVVSSTFDPSENFCRVELRSCELGGTVKLVREWQVLGATDIGDVVAVDHCSQTVFAAHSDSANVSVLFSDKDVHSVRKVIPVPFSSKIAKIIRFDVNESIHVADAMVLLSETCEMAVLRFEAPSSVRCTELKLSFSSPLATVSKRARNQLALACGGGTKVALRVIQFDFNASKETTVHEYPAIELPLPKEKTENNPEVIDPSSVLGCTIQPQSIFILYESGDLHAIRCPNFIPAVHRGNLNGWWLSQGTDPHERNPAPLHSTTAIFSLLSGLVTHRTKAKRGSVGGICALGDNYVVVAFARYSSVWDAAYHTDHGYVELSDVIQCVQSSAENGVVFLEAESKVHALEFDLEASGGRLSLADALKRKGSCSKIVTANSGPVKDTLLSAQPVSVSSLKTAANAGKNFSQLYEKHLSTAKTADEKRITRIVNRVITAKAVDLEKLNESFVRKGETLLRGKHGESSELFLTMLPSEQLAAVTVARCLIEITQGNFKFVVPLIDMLGAGSVAFETVMQELGPLGAEYGVKVQSLSSIAAYLCRIETMYALEAVVSAVPDLPESDIVRAAQFANRIYEGHNNQLDALQKQYGDVNRNSLPRSSRAQIERSEELVKKARGLILKCVVARTDKNSLIDSFRKVRQEDVKSMLMFFSEVISAFRTRCSDPLANASANVETTNDEQTRNAIVKPKTKAESAAYRGIENWLDSTPKSIERRTAEGEELKGCIAWTGMLLDAHLSSLFLDVNCHPLLASLHSCVTEQRRYSDMATRLIGCFEHIEAGLPVPRFKPLYEVFKIELGSGGRAYR